MDDGLYDLLSRGRTAAKVGELREARYYLEWVLRRVSSLSPERLEALYWLSEISSDPGEKRECLTDILAVEPGNSRARYQLAILDGKLDPAQKVDPDKVQVSSEPIQLEEGETRRFTCPSCGGRMVFTPDGSGLTCEFCDAHQQVTQPASPEFETQSGSPIPGEDFLLSMVTARAHLHPASVQFGGCQACGAEFILPAASLTLACPYCDSAYVVTHSVDREMIDPAGLIPFAISSREGQRSLAIWLSEKRVHPDNTIPLPQGIYLPVWSFSMGGQINYRGWSSDGNKAERVEGSQPVFRSQVLVPASPHLRDQLVFQLDNYDIQRLVPYDARYLVDWLAETYTISVAQASLEARERTFREEKARGSIQDGVRDVTFSSAGLVVDQYQLILLPVWIGRYMEEGRRVDVFINGQNGSVQGPNTGGIQSWMERLFGS